MNVFPKNGNFSVIQIFVGKNEAIVWLIQIAKRRE
jgi:hypothetical protein